MVYACGTDEHGVPITLTAEREGKDPQEVVDYWWANMKETFERFGISFDNFSRTSTPLHAKNTQLFYRKLKEAATSRRRVQAGVQSCGGSFCPTVT